MAGRPLMQIRLMLIELVDLQVDGLLRRVALDETDTNHNLKRPVEVPFRAPRTGEHDVLDGEGVTGHAAEIVCIGNDQRKEHLAELSELASFLEQLVKLARTPERA